MAVDSQSGVSIEMKSTFLDVDMAQRILDGKTNFLRPTLCDGSWMELDLSTFDGYSDDALELLLNELALLGKTRQLECGQLGKIDIGFRTLTVRGAIALSQIPEMTLSITNLDQLDF